jgi:putative ABC transport system permease protein
MIRPWRRISIAPSSFIVLRRQRTAVLADYVLADLVRNPRRTLSTMIGVTLGVGLFCGVLFFVDGLSASMTQRAVAPLPIDMQRIVTERVGGALTLAQRFDPNGAITTGQRATVTLELRNPSAVTAHEVTIRSLPGPSLQFVVGSANVDGGSITGSDDNPFGHGAAGTGLNIGEVSAGATVVISYDVASLAPTELDDANVVSSFSSRESVTPVAANQPTIVPLDQLAQQIGRIAGVARASELSLVDLGADTVSIGGRSAPGPTKLFGFDAAYAASDPTIDVTAGGIEPGGAVISAESARSMQAEIGDTVSMTLPDSTRFDVRVTGIADLSRARSLFASRRGSDLEAFVYSRNAVVVSPEMFVENVMPAYERAATTRSGRFKNPPIREVDIWLERGLLEADPATAAAQTKRIGAEVTAVADHQDFLLDNISNTLAVAAGDAAVAKRLFVFLGVPGGLLAAMLAAYAGTVLADAQRREQATLRTRGASRRHLLRMLALRTGLLTVVGSLFGLVTGYVLAGAILGRQSLGRASTRDIATSAVLGSLAGFVATGLALYITGRRSIDREINEDRARLARRVPLWRRARADLVGCSIVFVGTVVAVRNHAFDGASGSVYFGRAARLDLGLLVLPLAIWLTGSLVAARVVGAALVRTQPTSTSAIRSPIPGLLRRSVGRRPWAIGNGAIVVSLIVALATSLGAFTTSYDAAKARDARYATGSDLRVTPAPTARRTYSASDATMFRTGGVAETSPVIYTTNNVILRSARTSDPANLAAVDPGTYGSVAPLEDSDFVQSDAATALATLRDDPRAIMVSTEFAAFLKVHVGDELHVLLARGTDAQVEVDLHIIGFFVRLPGFPDGADALITIAAYTAGVPSQAPDFFLAAASAHDDAALARAAESLERGPAAADHIHIETRATTLARDQSSLAALNVAGLVTLDSAFALGMAVVAIAIFVFGLLLQRRREYVTLRAQGVEPWAIRILIAAEAAMVAVCGVAAGLLVGVLMGFYFVEVLRPLFVLAPVYTISIRTIALPVAMVLVATIVSSLAGSRLVNRLEPTELLRDE